MALPASGEISMSQVNVELGLGSTALVSLNDTAVRTLAGVASGQISLDSLHGKSNLSSTMSAVSGNDFAISPSNAACTLTLSNAGTWTCVGGGSGTWRGGGASSAYECRMTTVSGSLTSGTVGSWLNLGTSQSWSRNESRDGYYTSTYTGTLEIRLAASPFTVLSSTSVYLEAAVEV